MVYRCCGRSGIKRPAVSFGQIPATDFAPFIQWVLTKKHLSAIAEESRPVQGKSLFPMMRSEPTVADIPMRDEIAEDRNQTWAQMAIACVSRDDAITVALNGASLSEQVADVDGAIDDSGFGADECALCAGLADHMAINLWAAASEAAT